MLHVSIGTVNRDLSILRQQAKANILFSSGRKGLTVFDTKEVCIMIWIINVSFGESVVCDSGITFLSFNITGMQDHKEQLKMPKYIAFILMN
jgi:hypothetical protein